MKLALIYPPFYHKKFNENLPTVDDEFGIFPHVNFGYVSTAAKSCGWEVKLFDAAATKQSFSEFLIALKEFNPDLIGMTAHAVQTFQDMLDWAVLIKKHTDLPLLVGGYEAKIYPKEIMSHQCFDYLCSGEAQTFLPPFLKAFENKSDFNKVPDLYYRANGSIKTTNLKAPLAFVDFNLPDRSIFNHNLYYSHVSQRKNFTIGMSSIGCPYTCSFCCMAKTGFEERTPEQIVMEMKACVNDHDIHEIDWFDPVMLQNKDRISNFSKILAQEKLDIIWSTRARIDSLTMKGSKGKPDELFIRNLAESGCKRLFLGVESGDQDILNNVHKGLRVNQIHDVLSCAKEHGIMLLGFFMIGNPGETKQSVKKTVDLAKSLPLDYSQFSIAVMKPHTELSDKYMVDSMGYDFWKEYIKGNAVEQVLPTPWTDMGREECEKLSKAAYLSFYLRPRYIFKMILSITTFEEFFRYVRVALQLIFRPVGYESGSFNKIKRSMLFFVEGVLATFNKYGARHEFNKWGKGFKAICKMSVKEWF